MGSTGIDIGRVPAQRYYRSDMAAWAFQVRESSLAAESQKPMPVDLMASPDRRHLHGTTP